MANRPTTEDKARCICGRCPSRIAGDKVFFCVQGRSELRPEELGCICRTCPVYIEYQYDPSGHFYCRRGAAKQ